MPSMARPKGTPQSAEVREKISKNNARYWLGKKRTMSDEWKRKQSLRVEGLETRKKRSESMKGEKCFFWKGGVTKENQLIRTRLEYKLWRTAVFERDNYTCIWCGKRCGNEPKKSLPSEFWKQFGNKKRPELGALAVDFIDKVKYSRIIYDNTPRL